MALNILQISWIRFGPCVPIDYESGTFLTDILQQHSYGVSKTTLFWS